MAFEYGNKSTAQAIYQIGVDMTSVDDDLQSHKTNYSNPHNVDYTDVGAAPLVHTHTASDVTDFDTEVSNNTDVAANTSARHTQNTDTKLDEGGANEISAATLRDHVDDADKHREINDSGTAVTDLWSADKLIDEFGDKADKVSGATNGNFAGLDATGNLTDSGYDPSDFEAAGAVSTHESTYDHSKLHTRNDDDYLDQGGTYQVSAVDLRGHLDDADIHREINDTATGTTDLWSASKINSELSNKINVLSPAVAGNFVTQTAGGQLQDAGIDSTDIVLQTEVGAANGVCPLGADSKVPSSYLPGYDGLTYKGTLDASGGTYPSSPDQGDYYIISVAGTISGTDYEIGDWAAYNGSSWDKVDNTDKVTSVNGATGTVVLDTDDIDEGSTHLYYTETRVSNNTNVSANTAARHTQNTDTELDNGGANNVTAAQLKTHINDADKHRLINDSGTAVTDLWSGNKINSELATKAPSSHALDYHSDVPTKPTSGITILQNNAGTLSWVTSPLIQEFTSSVTLIKNNGNSQTFTHSLNNQFPQVTVAFRPASGTFQDKWINAEGVLTVEYAGVNTVTVYNSSSQDIASGRVKVVLHG